MRRGALLVLCASILAACGGPAKTSCNLATQSPAAGQHRGLYVSDASAAALAPDRARALIDLISTGHFDTVVLYNLGPLLEATDGAPITATLLRRLRAADVRTIAAPVGSPRRVQQLMSLARSDPDARFDALITEFEYWNQCALKDAELADGVRTDCFPAMQTLVTSMQEAAAGTSLRLGAYLGSPTSAEVAWLKDHLQFVFLDYPVRSPDDAWRSSTNDQRRLIRLEQCAGAGFEVWPIFYSRGEAPMRPWLCEHGLSATEQTFLSGLAALPSPEAARSRLAGFQYFADDGFSTAP